MAGKKKDPPTVQQQIETLLETTNRDGISDLIKYLRSCKFYDAPASTKYHGCERGALAVHSLNVFQCAEKLAKAWLSETEYNALLPSIIICALLHDLGKAGQFGKPLYVDNILKSGNVSETQPFKINENLATLQHEVVSCIEATKFIDLTEDEQRAIAWHNGLYGLFKYDIPGKETALYMIIHFADMWASRIIE